MPSRAVCHRLVIPTDFLQHIECFEAVIVLRARNPQEIVSRLYDPSNLPQCRTAIVVEGFESAGLRQRAQPPFIQVRPAHEIIDGRKRAACATLNNSLSLPFTESLHITNAHSYRECAGVFVGGL